MFIATHKKIAEYAYEMLSDDIKSYIDTNSLIEGSYYPDVNLKYTTINHDYEGSIGILTKHIKAILKKRQDSTELGKHLGIICHFVTDYCSPYHTNATYKRRGIIEHLSYEYRTKNFPSVFAIQDYEYNHSYFTGVNKLPIELKKFIDNHMQGKKDISRELKLSLLNSYHVLNIIMKEYIKIHITKDNFISFIAPDEYALPAAAYSVSNAALNFEG